MFRLMEYALIKWEFSITGPFSSEFHFSASRQTYHVHNTIVTAMDDDERERLFVCVRSVMVSLRSVWFYACTQFPDPIAKLMCVTSKRTNERVRREKGF